MRIHPKAFAAWVLLFALTAFAAGSLTESGKPTCRSGMGLNPRC